MGAPSNARVRETYERIAESFAATRRVPWPEVKAFLETLPRGARVLDLGCGNGRHVGALADVGYRAVGVDFSRRLLTLGQERFASGPRSAQVSWIEAEASALPLRSESMDACISVALLHHLPSRNGRVATLREVRRVLAPGAPAFVSVWAHDQPRFRDSPTTDVEVPWTLPDGTVVRRFYHLFQQGELASIIIESGLHGETFFRARGNMFALARKDG